MTLSACDTAKGMVDYSEGAYNLARAFRIAGASQVLITLDPLYDQYASEFMVDFYTAWLARADGDAAIALRETKLAWATGDNALRADPRAWAPYMLIETSR